MSQVSGSFSLHSFLEGSEAISEAEEIQEVKHLQRRGDKAFYVKNFTEALKCYNDALEIEEKHVGALSSRAAVYIEMGNYVLAQQDAEKALLLDPHHVQAHYLLGSAHANLGQYKEGLNCYLNALELDTHPDHTDMLANDIASLAHHFCSLPEKLVENLPKMDGYKKLCEVGVCLYQAKRYEQAIKVLNSAQKVATNQKGITMKVQLTLANAYSALNHTDIAISLYQECLATAVSTHDYQYQTKTLVNIASLFLESGDTHRAIVHYKRLLDLEKEIQGDDLTAPLPDYWTRDLKSALQLNLSIAYKTIASMEQAVYHAQNYVKLIQESSQRKDAEARSYYNVGTLHEILGEYTEALENYQNYLQQSKQKGDKHDVAQAYGCLGAVYAYLNNHQLALTYHDQSISIAKILKDSKVLAKAYEQFGDSYFKFQQYNDAIDCYMQMARSCMRPDLLGQAAALCRIGAAYRAQQRFQYSIYYFEQAKMISEDFEPSHITTLCEYNLACILQHSTQILEIDQAKKYFERLIPIHEAKIEQHKEEDTFCPSELRNQLEECYIGLINILGNTGYKDEALVYSEAFHRRLVTQLLNASAWTSKSSLNMNSHCRSFDMWSIEKITRIVNEQNSTVLYYTMLPSCLLLWVLRPGHGVVRFYTAKHTHLKVPVSEYLETLIGNLLKKRNLRELMYDCENRALPEQGIKLKVAQRQNQELGGATGDDTETDQFSSELYSTEGSSTISLETNETDSDAKVPRTPQKSPERLLFDFLIAPVDDILSSLEENSPLVIIPDKELHRCPFGVIKDWNGIELRQRFWITYLPSIYVLDRVTKNEFNQLRRQDQVEFDRSQSCLGGMPKVLPAVTRPAKLPMYEFASRLPTTRTTSNASEQPEPFDARKTSNPRLSKFGELTVPPVRTQSPGSAFVISRGSKVSVKSKQSVTEKTPPVGVSMKSATGASSTLLDRMVARHTIGTLVSKTSTNTNITTSPCQVTEYRQVCDKEKCFIFGNPKLPKKVWLRGREWEPKKELTKAQSECFKVAQVLNVTAVVGEEATKDRFLKDIQGATIVHIATLACPTEGLLVTTPNVRGHEQGPPLEQSYVVTSAEIVSVPLVAKLVVLSAGWSTYGRDKATTMMMVSSAFLTAGAQCVVQLLWPIPNAALNKFYVHFYQAFLEGVSVTSAVAIATEHLKQSERYKCVTYWGTFVVFGKDVRLDLGVIQRAELDQTIDRVENEVNEDLDTPLLNPTPITPDVAPLEDNLSIMQKYVGELVVQHQQQPNIVPHLITLLDGALKRLHMEDNNRKTTQLPHCVSETEAGLKLLKLLGFHFQGIGESLVDPYIVYPHWNHDNLLVPTYEALCAVLDTVSNVVFVRALYELLPAAQKTISYMVDVLCITKHAPEIQLKVTDMSVQPLWKNPKVKAVFMAMGFHQIGPLLNFNTVPSSRKLLMAGLQLLISFSSHKSPTLLHKLDVSLLGGPGSATKSSNMTYEHVRLPSLAPLQLPRNQLRMSTPWLSTVEHPSEMEGKRTLARSKSELDTTFRQHLIRAKTWHQVSLSAQADESLGNVGRPFRSLQKVKVQAGSTASCQRHPVDEQRILGIPAVDQRRDYAHFVLNQRLDTISLRHRDSVRKAYLPYVQNV